MVLAPSLDLLPGARARVFINVLPLLATMQPAYRYAKTDVRPGERVRIHMADGRMMSGTLVSWSSEQVSVSVPEYAMRSVIRTMGQPDFTTLENGTLGLVIRTDGIAQLERSVGRKSNARRFGKYGFIGGALLGWATYSDDAYIDLGPGGTAVVVGGELGLVGLGIGSLIRTERWEPASLPSSSR